MDFQEFKRECSERSLPFALARSHLTRFAETLYHFKVYDFVQFCDVLKKGHWQVLILSDFWHDSHVHVICRQSDESATVAAAEPITHPLYLRHVLIHFFLFRDRHDTACRNGDVLRSLKEACAATILGLVENPRDVATLSLPTNLTRYVLWNSERYFRLRLPDDEKATIDRPFNRLEDQSHSASFVAKFQLYHFRSWFNCSAMVSYDYLSDLGETIRTCLECSRASGIRVVWRRHCRETRFEHAPTNPNRWCRVCKRVPLFLLLKVRQYRKRYGPPTTTERRRDNVVALDHLPDGRAWSRRDSTPKEEFVARVGGDPENEWFRGTAPAAPDDSRFQVGNGDLRLSPEWLRIYLLS